ncbi:MAG: cytochrome C [bacterium]|nr:cytochrome C [bacterium]
MNDRYRMFTRMVLGMALIGTADRARAQQRVSETVHNLAVSGPGAIRSPSERQVCVFCHATHNTAGIRPLWNRELSVASYTIYQSSTLDADPGQPTGSSKLCLSCHDGTIALGSVLSRGERIRMAGGDFLPAGLTNLGTDLSDDHPISFYYTAGIAASDRQLANPGTLPPEVRLDDSGQLQCTSCHDAHDNTNGDFLTLNPEYGTLCIACHQMDGWAAGAHRNASASVAGGQGVDWPYGTVSQNACRSCHQSHTAGGHERLLIFEDDEENCLPCHNGQVATQNIEAQLDKLSAHDPRRYREKHDPVETPSQQKEHVECADCHNPHAATAPIDQAGYQAIGPTMTNVRGVTLGGQLVDQAQAEYEVCFRCHGDAAVDIHGRVPRHAQSNNLRLKFAPSNPSFHPVVSSSPSPDTVSLVPGLSTGSLILCSDCHSNDNGPGAGGNGPSGPHGSIYDFLLERNYTVRDDTPESEYEYAMCYKCHLRTSILSDASFSSHRLHVQEENTPCSACHDPHGINPAVIRGSEHTHLINFDTSFVFPESVTGRLEFKDNGRFAGSCTLVCHGREHRDETYREEDRFRPGTPKIRVPRP